jgi:hypothetical protein
MKKNYQEMPDNMRLKTGSSSKAPHFLKPRRMGVKGRKKIAKKWG